MSTSSLAERSRGENFHMEGRVGGGAGPLADSGKRLRKAHLKWGSPKAVIKK